MFVKLCALSAVAGLLFGLQGEEALTPAQARKQVGKKVTVEMTVRSAKDRLENRGEIYLDAEEDFRDEKNFAVVITKVGAAKLIKAGIADPAEHYRDKKIRASGIVKEVQMVPPHRDR